MDVHWPTAVDYQAALQTPALCFSHPALKEATVHTDTFGLPLVATGNVVVVFRIRAGEADVAVRCFTRKTDFDVVAYRYHALNQHLQQVDLPAVVPCTFLPSEIQVHDAWYPVVQMPWMQGLPLHRYIEKYLEAPEVLLRLAEQWRTLMAQLRAARFAHGDLSDGNVLVDNTGCIHLIDYDAAYVPALEGEPPAEVGKPDYQHPDRMRPGNPHYGYYAPNLDAFSALAIYVSIRALAEDPSRWECYHTGENLLFDQEDYRNPGYTPIWLDLRNGAGEEVRRLIQILEGYCRASVADLPTLEHALQGEIPPRREQRKAQLAEDPTVLSAHLEVAPGPGPLSRLWQAFLAWVRQPIQLPFMIGIGAFVVVGMVLLMMLSRSGDGAGRRLNLALPPSAAASYLVPEDLVGFYTGYATSLDGDREPMALSIDSLNVHPETGEVQFNYDVNWKSHRVAGVGTYNVATGHLDLESHFVLYVARASTDEVELVSLTHRDQRPLVKVNKRFTP